MAIEPPPGIDLSEDQGPRIVASMIALIVLPTIAVIARLASRMLAGAGLWYDDLWVVVSLFLSYGPIICAWVSHTNNGFGRHIWALPPEYTVQFLLILYVYEVFYCAAISAIKICILTFYARIFPVQELKLVLRIAMGVVIAFFLGSLLSTIFQCTPIQKFWHRDQPGHRTDLNNIILVPGGINCALDFLIIILPIALLWRLRTTTSQKSVLTGIFICAGFVCIISIIRLVVLSRLELTDLTWNYVNSAIWSCAEPCMGVISACLPSLRPLVALMTKGTYHGHGMQTNKKTTDAGTSSSGSSQVVWQRRKSGDKSGNYKEAGLFTRLRGDMKGDPARWGRDIFVRGGHDVEAGEGDNVSLQEMNVPSGQIKVKEEIVITSSDWLDYKDRLY